MESCRKTIIFDAETCEKIQKLADESERDFSGQVRYMVKQFLEMKEKVK